MGGRNRQRLVSQQAVFEGDGDGFRAVGCVELREDCRDVELDAVRSDPEHFRDVGVCEPAAHGRQDFHLPFYFCGLLERIVSYADREGVSLADAAVQVQYGDYGLYFPIDGEKRKPVTD